MNPDHLIADLHHVQISAPEGFSASLSALARTIPRIAVSMSWPTRFHQRLFGVDWKDYAISVKTGQLLIQSRLSTYLAMNNAKNESRIKITERVNAISKSSSKPI